MMKGEIFGPFQIRPFQPWRRQQFIITRINIILDMDLLSYIQYFANLISSWVLKNP